MNISEDEILSRLNSDRNLLNLNKKDEESEQDKSEELSDDDALELLDSALDDKPKKRGPKGKHRSNEERADIGVLGQLIGCSEVSEALEISTAQPSLYSRGKKQTDYNIDDDLAKRVTKKLNNIRNITSRKLKLTVESIDDDKLKELGTNPEKASRVAMNLARVVEKTMPKVESNGPTANFIMMVPNIKKEEDYEVINV